MVAVPCLGLSLLRYQTGAWPDRQNMLVAAATALMLFLLLSAARLDGSATPAQVGAPLLLGTPLVAFTVLDVGSICPGPASGLAVLGALAMGGAYWLGVPTRLNRRDGSVPRRPGRALAMP